MKFLWVTLFRFFRNVVLPVPALPQSLPRPQEDLCQQPPETQLQTERIRRQRESPGRRQKTAQDQIASDKNPRDKGCQMNVEVGN